MAEFSIFLLFLTLYSFLGWIAELIFVVATTGKLTNPGFLTGPLVPIYGVGAIAILLLVTPRIENPFFVFLLSVVIASALEFLTHLVLDKVFHIRLWDYSDRPLNLQGRICLQNSLAFGGLALLLVFVIHPAATAVIGALPEVAAIAVAWSLFGVLLVDFGNSVLRLAILRPQLALIRGSLAEAHEAIEKGIDRAQDQLEELSTVNRATLRKLTKAFPHGHSTKPR